MPSLTVTPGPEVRTEPRKMRATLRIVHGCMVQELDHEEFVVYQIAADQAEAVRALLKANGYCIKEGADVLERV